MVSGRSSENTSTTNLSGDNEPGSADSGDTIGNIFLTVFTAASRLQPASYQMPLFAFGKLTEVHPAVLPVHGQMYRVGRYSGAWVCGTVDPHKRIWVHILVLFAA